MDFRQWYYERLKPWINFVPIAADMSDLTDKIAWLRDHDDAARAIGAQGQALVFSMDYEGELMPAGRTITAALRHFAFQLDTEQRFGRGGVETACLQDGGGPVPLPDVVPTRQEKGGSMPVLDLGDESLKDLFSVFRDTMAGDVFGPFNGLPAPGPQIGDVDPSKDTMAEFASLLYSVKTAGDRYRLISLGAAPGEWALRAERSYRKLFPTGDYRSLNLEGDLSHIEMTQTLWRINNASLDLNVLRHAVIASQDGWAYFPKVNPDVDWGSALAAVSDNPDDLDKKIFMTDEGKTAEDQCERWETPGISNSPGAFSANSSKGNRQRGYDTTPIFRDPRRMCFRLSNGRLN